MIESWKAEIAKYKLIIDNANAVATSLGDAHEELNKANNLVNYFAINGDSPDNGEIKNNCENINSIISKINDIITKAQTKINELEKKIQEELERIRREQEAELK